MSLTQQIITIALCASATMFTRFFPFVVFSSDKPAPRFVQYLGKALPCAIFGMLVVYCLKDVSLLKGSHGIPEALGILVTAAVHRIKGSMLLSILCGTVCYMIVLHLFA
ncbi:MAG: branched-chain amino acid transporter permease [Pseudoramibacter sp.]